MYVICQCNECQPSKCHMQFNAIQCMHCRYVLCVKSIVCYRTLMCNGSFGFTTIAVVAAEAAVVLVAVAVVVVVVVVVVVRGVAWL